MAIRPVIYMGNPNLRRMSKPVHLQELPTVEFKQLIIDMQETMDSLKGIGLAAPQIDIDKQLVLIKIDNDNPRYKQILNSCPQMPAMLIIINPKITILNAETQSFWEGCLSIPGLRGLVARPKKIRVDYTDAMGLRQTIVAEDFLATVLQHELDHLFGKLYPDRIKDPLHLVFESEYLKLQNVCNKQSIDD